jgi:hypothetical protein
MLLSDVRLLDFAMVPEVRQNGTGRMLVSLYQYWRLPGMLQGLRFETIMESDGNSNVEIFSWGDAVVPSIIHWAAVCVIASMDDA